MKTRLPLSMFQPIRSVLFLTAVSMLSWGQTSPCGSTAANRDLTGAWQSQDSRGITSNATLTQTGTTVSGRYTGTAAAGHPNLVGTFTASFDGTTLKASDLVVTEGSTTAHFVMTLTLSVDGNHLDDATGTTGIHWTRISGTATLVPAALSLKGVPGGSTVAGAVVLYNCGGAALNWQATPHTIAGGNWVTVTPPSGSLGTGGSATLTITADPKALIAAQAPYRGDITVTASNAGAATTTIDLSFGGDTISLSNIGPAVGVELESETDLRFGADILYTLSSAPSADVSLEVVDAANPLRVIASSNTLHTTQSGTFKASFIISTFQIPKEVSMVRLRAVLKPPTQRAANGEWWRLRRLPASANCYLPSRR